MTIVVTPNVALLSGTDKTGHALMTWRNVLVASGFYRVVGSGDGRAAVANRTQTAGPSYDVFTGNGGLGYQTGSPVWNNTYINTISNPGAWLALEQIATGWVWIYQRSTSGAAASDALGNMYVSLGGIATSGATAGAPPASVGVGQYLVGGVATFANCGFGDSSNTALYMAQAQHGWVHVGVSDSLRAGSVCPWYMATLSRTDGTKYGFWGCDSLLGAPAAETVKGVFWAGTSANTAGLVGFTATGFFNQTVAYAGSALGGVRARQVIRGTVAFPGSASIPLNADGEWDSSDVSWDYASNSMRAGVSENMRVNYLSRDYPSTAYIGSAAPVPRLYWGKLLLHWPQATAPSWTP